MSEERTWLQIAEGLAVEAAATVMTFFQKTLQTNQKADDSPVTEADLASDRLLRAGLRKNFPGHAVLTEENGLDGDSKSDHIWLIDPLDGTKAFAKGISGFCVMVGLLRRGHPLLGVVVDPLEGRTYRALRGAGAELSQGGKAMELKVSGRSDFSQMPLIVSTGFPAAPLQKIEASLGSPLLPPVNSVGIKVGFLVRGEADLYVNHHPVSYWDTAAPLLILEEAGGVFTDLAGRPLEYPMTPPFGHGRKTLASNGRRHAEVVERLKASGLD
ncbi:MAG TPA: 3'(2'),5'-bisphosphate nucleotidase CysQ [bacterium]|nr:3'(2'),5'-bisphosphate nucleotidase CysQ [bacterium]